MRHVSLVLLGCLLAGCDTPQPPGGSDAVAASPGQAAPPALEVLATGANIAGANGIHFGPDGLLYVASVIGSDLTVLNPDNGEVVRRLTADDGVIGPDDVAFASDGSFFWTSILTGEVAGFDAAGNRVVAAQLPPGPNPVTFSDDDRLFISQCFLGTNVYELDPKGVEQPRLIAGDLGPGCGLNGMDWGPDGRLYGPRWFVGEVISLDVDTGERRVEATGFVTPAAVKFDSAGVLHVLDTGAGTVVRLGDDAREVIATLTPGLDNFAFDADDTVYVSSFTDGFVKRVNADGTQTTLQPGGMAHPGGIAMIGEVVWVADIHAIRGFDRKSGAEVATQRNVVGVGEMGGAINLAADGEQLILTSWFDGDVRVWDPQAQQRTAHFTNLAQPVAAVRYAGGVAVAEHGTGSVTLQSSDGASVLVSELPAPTGLVARGDDLFVSDRSRGQILKVASSGKALPEPVIVASGLESPEGFLLTDDGLVVVEADAARVVSIDAEGARRVLAEFPAGSAAAAESPPSQVFNGVAMGPDGHLFITGEAQRSLYRVALP
ncbi:MAG: hypothetical protein AAGG11_00845 [Pseudomonadota bacterium]